MAERIRILSIDGGGIRGIIPAMVIKALLGDVKAQDAFHIIAGTSTGGIIACGLAKPDPVSIQKIIDLYVGHGHEVFRKPENFLHWWYRPRYRPTALEQYRLPKMTRSGHWLGAQRSFT
jgi:patatin-like phospholipase/acyl hydrolase